MTSFQRNLSSNLLCDDHVSLVATGFVFTEGPLWDPAGFLYFADLYDSKLYRVVPKQVRHRRHVFLRIERHLGVDVRVMTIGALDVTSRV